MFLFVLYFFVFFISLNNEARDAWADNSLIICTTLRTDVKCNVLFFNATNYLWTNTLKVWRKYGISNRYVIPARILKQLSFSALNKSRENFLIFFLNGIVWLPNLNRNDLWENFACMYFKRYHVIINLDVTICISFYSSQVIYRTVKSELFWNINKTACFFDKDAIVNSRCT